MRDIVAKAITKYYTEKDYAAFRKKCKNKLDLFKEIKDYAAKYDLDASAGAGINFPSKEWYIDLNGYKKGNFEIAYTTMFKISKVAPLFNINHDFYIKNKSKDLIEPTLLEGSDHPYCKDQAALHGKILSVMKAKGYIQLSYAEMDETVQGFKMPPEIKIFGKNMTVSQLLFSDPFDICEEFDTCDE